MLIILASTTAKLKEAEEWNLSATAAYNTLASSEVKPDILIPGILDVIIVTIFWSGISEILILWKFKSRYILVSVPVRYAKSENSWSNIFDSNQCFSLEEVDSSIVISSL